MNAEIKEIKDFSGGINRAKVDWDIADNEAVDIENFEFSPTGSLVKRLGCTKVNASEITWIEHTTSTEYTANKIWHLHKFYSNAGTTEVDLVWAHFLSGVTEFVAILKWDGETFTHLEIIDLGPGSTQCKLHGDAYISSTLIADRLVFVNGVNLAYWFDYGDNKVKRLGIVAPTVITSATHSNSTGALTSDGVYKYKFTWKNDTDSIESAPSAELTVDIDAGDDTVVLTLPATADTNVNKMRIYRTAAGGTEFYLVEEVTNATTYTDLVSDATLITQAAYDTDVDDNQPPPTAPEYCLAFQNRLFLVKNNILYFSKIGEPDYFPTLNYIDIGLSEAGIIKGLVILNEELWIAYQNGFRKATVSGATTTWSISELMNGPGVFDSRSVKVVEGLPVPVGQNEVGEIIYAGRGAIIYLSFAGQIWAFDAYRFHYIGEKIEELVKDIPLETLRYAPAVYYPKKHQYKISFDDVVLGLGVDIPTGGSGGAIPYNNKTLVFDVKLKAWSRENRMFECADVHSGGDDEGELWVGSIARGFIYKQDTGGKDELADAITDISAFFKSKQYSFGKVNQNKRFRKVYLDAFGDSTIMTTINIDRGKHTFETSNTLSDYGTDTTWNEATWDLLASPTFMANINGSLGTGNYKYKYYFRNPTTGDITGLSYESSNMASGVNPAVPSNGITFQIPEDANSYTQGYTQYYIWRTKVGGLIFYYEQNGTRSAAGVAQNINSTVADATLVLQASDQPDVLIWAESGYLEHSEDWLDKQLVGKLFQFIFQTEDDDTSLQINGLGIALKLKTQH